MKTIFLLALLISAQWARADQLSITIFPADQPAYPGSVLTYTGTITNLESGVVDLNAIDITFSGQGSADGTVFYAGPVSVDPLATTDPFALFTLSVDFPYTDPFGTIAGSISILGGLEGVNGYDSSTQDFLGSQVFGVTVVPSPEPRTSVLLLMAMPALLVVARKFRFARARNSLSA